MQSRATHFMSLRGIANGDAVAISRKGTILKTTQDTFVLAWSNDGAKKHAVGRVFESLFVLPCYLPTNPLMASSISL